MANWYKTYVIEHRDNLYNVQAETGWEARKTAVQHFSELFRKPVPVSDIVSVRTDWPVKLKINICDAEGTLLEQFTIDEGEFIAMPDAEAARAVRDVIWNKFDVKEVA